MAVTVVDPVVCWAIVILPCIVTAVYAPFLFWSVVAASCYVLLYSETDELNMEKQAEDLLVTVKDNNVSPEVKLKDITELKAHIKHRHVPDAAISPSFEIIRIGIMSLPLQDAAFSILSHLTKRLVLQEQQHIVAVQGAKTYPLLVERLGDQKDRVRIRASQAFTDLWLAASADVEEVIRDVVLPGKHPRAKEAGLQWISKASSTNLPEASLH